jgi:hypothetical protein
LRERDDHRTRRQPVVFNAFQRNGFDEPDVSDRRLCRAPIVFAPLLEILNRGMFEHGHRWWAGDVEDSGKDLEITEDVVQILPRTGFQVEHRDTERWHQRRHPRMPAHQLRQPRPCSLFEN